MGSASAGGWGRTQRVGDAGGPVGPEGAGGAGTRRRVPKQARARERVERILDAARSALEARPVAEITMEGIAERAGVPVGSLYQYFGSKTSLLAAVAEMVMAEADAETARQLATSRSVAWREAVDRVLEATFRFYQHSPPYRQVLHTIRYTPEFAQITADSNERVADLMSLHPAFARAGLSRDKALVICRTVVTAANAIQDRLVAQEDADFEVWLEETKRLVKGYLATYVG
ncbi:MAG: TetR/AcrR family transcriptional regulator [Myxococcota bacterium]|nr:TetR/AcrR family transcriptional regulator [Myxococcota bacterium]